MGDAETFFFPGRKWGDWEFQQNQIAVQKYLTYVKIPKYFGSKHFLSIKEKEVFNSTVIICSFVLYCLILVYSLK